MTLETLDNFIQARLNDPKKWPRNSYVDHPGWASMYIRLNPRYINGQRYDPVIDLANIEAIEYGKGTFKTLIKHLRSTYPTLGIYVESVLTEQFRVGLAKMGFVMTANSGAANTNFFMAARAHCQLPSPNVGV